jgi:hypothetical protein
MFDSKEGGTSAAQKEADEASAAAGTAVKKAPTGGVAAARAMWQTKAKTGVSAVAGFKRGGGGGGGGAGKSIGSSEVSRAPCRCRRGVAAADNSAPPRPAAR